NFQESFGWLATLLNDRYGQYHIQESGFHKSCYDCFLTNNIQPVSPEQGNTNTSYHQEHSSSKIPTYRTVAPSTIPFQKPPQNHTHYRQNEFHPRQEPSYFLVSDSANFTNRESQPTDKQSVINRMMRDPNSFPNLNYDLKNDEDVVAAALSGCKS